MSSDIRRLMGMLLFFKAKSTVKTLFVSFRDNATVTRINSPNLFTCRQRDVLKGSVNIVICAFVKCIWFFPFVFLYRILKDVYNFSCFVREFSFSRIIFDLKSCTQISYLISIDEAFDIFLR